MHYSAAVEAGGLRGMRERAVAIGASLSIRSNVGDGTTVSLVVPANDFP